MLAPDWRNGGTPAGAMRLLAALVVALMAMGGVALAAPKGEPGPPEQAQGNGPPPQAHDPTPGPRGQAKGHQGTGAPAEVPQAVAPQEVAPQAAPKESPVAAPHESGQGDASAGADLRGTSAPSGAGGQARATPRHPAESHTSIQRPSDGARATGAVTRSARSSSDAERGESSGDRHAGAAAESTSVLGASQAEGDDPEGVRNFDPALPFTGLQLLLMTAVGLGLALAGIRLRRMNA